MWQKIRKPLTRLIRRTTPWAAAGLLSCTAPGCTDAGTIYCCTGENNDLVSLLEDEGFRIIREKDAQTTLEKAPESAAVLLLNADYPGKVRQLTDAQRETIRRKQLHVFAEYTSLSDTVPQPEQIEFERIVVVDSLAPELLPMDLLSVNRGWYIRERAEKPLMAIARVAGFDTAVYGLEDTPYTPLVYKPDSNLWISTSQLSDFARIRFAPEFRWKAFWETVVGDLVGRKVTFGSWNSPVGPSYGEKQELPDSARLVSVRKGVEWFFNGHFLVAPSWKADWLDKYQGDGLMPVGPSLPDDVVDGDGTLGILEGHCSAIDGNGRQAYRYWMRNDVQGEVSMTFAVAGELFGIDSYKHIAANLVDFSFDSFRDGPRNDPQSPSYGLLSWAATSKGTYYGDDNARSILGMALAADLLGNPKWDRKIVEAILANYRTTGVHGFRSERLLEEDLQKYGWRHYRRLELVNPHPHFESWMWACYLWLYRQTGYKPLLDMCEDAISRTMEAYPDQWKWTNGLQQEKARMILPLAWLYRVSPTEKHREWLQFMVTEFLRNQVACGAVREELGDASKGSFGKVKSNEAYGTEEAPLIFDNGDPVADMLYTCNFAFFGLNEAARATGDPGIAEAAEKLSDFLTRIQVKSDSVRNVDGAWFRAFNYKNWDYWASDADAGWGALSTLTGWIQSWIVTTQALMEMQTSYWELTEDSTIGRKDRDLFEKMLD
ncbi:hypothetical protein [Alistipes senegalensis]|uniref:hypothetical protein n=1 Tax=Alistipes senegalensis TaxID=1288121 RepID=UPI0018A9A029|nr:hypothetical protein [Alistipes senegalensis]